MIEALLQSMGVKPSDFQEAITLAKSLDARLMAIEAGQRQILAAVGAHPNSPTCAVGGESNG
jgi:hypothetical protein